MGTADWPAAETPSKTRRGARCHWTPGRRKRKRPTKRPTQRPGGNVLFECLVVAGHWRKKVMGFWFKTLADIGLQCRPDIGIGRQKVILVNPQCLRYPESCAKGSIYTRNVISRLYD